MAKRSSRPSRPSQRDAAAAEEDRHERDVHVVDQVGGEELADGGGPPPIRTSRPSTACLAAASACAGPASVKWKVVPPFTSIEGLT